MLCACLDIFVLTTDAFIRTKVAKGWKIPNKFPETLQKLSIGIFAKYAKINIIFLL